MFDNLRRSYDSFMNWLTGSNSNGLGVQETFKATNTYNPNNMPVNDFNPNMPNSLNSLNKILYNTDSSNIGGGLYKGQQSTLAQYQGNNPQFNSTNDLMGRYQNALTRNLELNNNLTEAQLKELDRAYAFNNSPLSKIMQGMNILGSGMGLYNNYTANKQMKKANKEALKTARLNREIIEKENKRRDKKIGSITKGYMNVPVNRVG